MPFAFGMNAASLRPPLFLVVVEATLAVDSVLAVLVLVAVTAGAGVMRTLAAQSLGAMAE